MKKSWATEATSLDEFFKAVDKEEARIRRESCVRIDEGYLQIDMDSTTEFFRTYDIELSRISSPEAALDWIHQVLISKSWSTPKMCKDFLFILFNDVIPQEWWVGRT